MRPSVRARTASFEPKAACCLCQGQRSGRGSTSMYTCGAACESRFAVANLSLSALRSRSALPRRSCGSGGVWDDHTIHLEFAATLQRIKAAPIVHAPFAHLVIEPLFSPCLYDDLLHELPGPSAYEPFVYPGTHATYDMMTLSPRVVAGRRRVRLPDECCKTNAHGSSCPCHLEPRVLHNLTAKRGLLLKVQRARDDWPYPLWAQMFRFVHSINFTCALVDRLSIARGIPEWKQPSVRRAYEAGLLQNVASLRIEPTEYHLTPHIDMSPKIVTWQYFHPHDDQLSNRNVGTIFYAPKAHLKANLIMNDKANPHWLDYDLFDEVVEQRVRPNAFFAFAPNQQSWHGAAITPQKLAGVSSPHMRRTFLGFITTPYHRNHKRVLSGFHV